MILKQMYCIVEDVLCETQEGVIGIHSNFNTAPRSISYMDDFKNENSFQENDNIDLKDLIPSNRLKSNYLFTKTENYEITPGKICCRPKYKLKEICKLNKYQLSLKDFGATKIKIGQGAYGEVFIVNCKLNYNNYALKVLDKDIISQQGCERQIMREKEITYSLDHKNIIRLESYFHDSNYCYFLFELCRVGTLKTLINENRKLSLELTRFYAIELINVLCYLKKHNIVHRDLKPQNILIDDRFHIKVADFGAAKKIDPIEIKNEIK